MKLPTSLVLAALALGALATPVASLRAAAYTEAEFTRLENDVKVLKENSASHPATVGENVSAVTSVATGANSRAELRFPDKSLTRLGANSRFTIRGEQRTLDLDQGVMMLQVPKKMGGAKVRTAAVTAAVTGTTAMFEYLPNGYVKLIVIEGEVELYSNKSPSNFRVVHAGQMIIMDPKSTNIPLPVDVDLKRLLHTSKLLSQYENLPNTVQVNAAVQNQQQQIHQGDLQGTNLIIPGLGTLVSVTNNTVHGLNDALFIRNTPPTNSNNPPAGPGNTPTSNGNNSPNDNGQTASNGNTRRPPPNGPNSNNPPTNGPTPPAFQGFLPLISGSTVLNSSSTLYPDPTVVAYNSTTGGVLTSQGLIYHGQTQDGPFPAFAFGSNAPVDPNLQPFLNTTENGWGAFKFESLYINGTPAVASMPGDTVIIRDVILAANGDIILSATNPYGVTAPSGTGTLDLTSINLRGFALYSQNGSITVAEGFSISGTDGQDLALTAAGINSDVSILGSINIFIGVAIIGAGRDVLIDGGTVIARDLRVTAGRDIVVNGHNVTGERDPNLRTTNGNMVLSATRHINITNSGQLAQMAASTDGGGLLRLESINGDINILSGSDISGDNVEIEAFKGNITITDSSVSATNVLKARTLGPDGTLTIGNSTLSAGQLIRLYAEGSNGRVLFTENSTLTGGGHVDIAGKTVEIVGGKSVDTTGTSGINVYTDNPRYNKGGFGQFVRSGTPNPDNVVQPFASRPAY